MISGRVLGGPIGLELVMGWGDKGREVLAEMEV